VSSVEHWPQLSLGCGNFGGIGSAPAFFGKGANREEAFALLDAARAAGINSLDTADAYGGGASERFIGAWLAERGRGDLLVTTKVFHSVSGDPTDRGLAPDRIARCLQASLDRLGLEQVDLYLAHEPDPDTPIGRTIECFEQLRSRGLIGAWGLSNVDLATIEQALRHGRPALVQNSFSLLERGDEGEVIPLCAEQGIAYVPYGPLAGGWLAGRYKRGNAFPPGSRMTMRPEPYAHLVTDRVFDALEALATEARRLGTSMGALAFAWVLDHPGVSGAVCGPSRPVQLEPVLAALQLDLDSVERERVGSLFR
jgi:aryl-alcohol dehydrogenase-like predicted oxidoreductase